MRTSTDRLPGLTLTNLFLDVPLDHANDGAGTIEVFARVVTGQQRPADSVREAVRAAQRHYRT